MQYFIDTSTQKYWALDDSVIVQEAEGGFAFFHPEGSRYSDIPETMSRVNNLPAPSPPVPQVVSRFQGREAMWQTPHGEVSLFDAAEAVILHPDTPATYKRAWGDLQEFRRDSVMLQAIAENLGLSSADLDALFILAAGIKA
ncbi:hypothetical protein [Achromobacter sp.]|uniref:hypothetical protein n=1 Tax=Achromobacter sp. TaxID=134375 RepID=UPI0028ADE861|nr:hypothetical protein [Achromobacter sp.]